MYMTTASALLICWHYLPYYSSPFESDLRLSGKYQTVCFFLDFFFFKIKLSLLKWVYHWSGCHFLNADTVTTKFQYELYQTALLFVWISSCKINANNNINLGEIKSETWFWRVYIIIVSFYYGFHPEKQPSGFRYKSG